MPTRTPKPTPTRPANAGRVLVSGGAGFIGSHLVERLVDRGDRVCVVDDLSTGAEANLARVRDRIDFIGQDLALALSGDLAGERFGQIYHLAAAVGVELVMNEPVRAIETNVDLTAQVLRFSANTNTPTLIASSSEVYGKPGKELFSEEDDVLYGPTSVTRWSYACSKAIDEYLALAYAREGRVPAVVCRFFNTIGPRQLGDYGMVVPRFVRAALAGEPLRVYGDGSQSRCFCDVRDVTELLPRLLGEPTAAGRVFNVGSDTPITIMQLAELVIDTLKSDSTITTVAYSDAYPGGFEDLRHRRPDLTRVRDAVGFESVTPLVQTIMDIAASVRQGASLEAEGGA